MNKKIMLGDKEIEFSCSAATPILYKKLFRQDLLLDFSALKSFETKEEQGAKMNEIVAQLAYIMYLEANISAQEIFRVLNFEKYIEWLITIEPSQLEKKSTEFIELYSGNSVQTSSPKNE